MSIIEIKDLRKTYNEKTVPVHAVNGIDLQIEEGEFTAIVGPSGCGKTTFLNMVGGLDVSTSGSVKIDGQDISGLSSKQLIDFRLNHIGFVFQAYNLIPVLTAVENVAFIMELQGVSKAEREKRAKELLEQVGIGDKFNSRPNQLSGGQQQRVAVARALASKPKFILADEPTANLDSQSTGDLLDMMADLNQKLNITFLFATHDQRVMDRARRIVTLTDGKISSDEIRK
ncbi:MULTISPECIES: ABC transporter ATP-binding protein [unclassified Lentimicrobium]|uniref:ABC transporter ATP-binding protein n=1 Tax=unclassified Lentimicrobium TaxID=2677434 RepID=UPI001556D644|nr:MULTISPECIES: ABC transporter ATP-binding protein [unclassified Lentimicrobium]NPD48031.1 ABC transporter ATP-binding protein [Lentimicrobium sp. S6]NPD86589.1 ABC transporter ATP-binding protein [Lentimicrobium sp. L6]